MAGRLIYLIGPSGAGKDSLLNAAREQLAAMGCRVARRVITRSAEAQGEEAISLSPTAFDEQKWVGAFAMSWQANGLSYGIPRQINEWLAAGDNVLVNGSRAYLAEARARYPDMLAILLKVNDAVLRERLLQRGRESEAEIEQRLARNAQFASQATAGDEQLLVLDNSSNFEQTVANLISLIGPRRACA
ncbi:phosphonate metabolism protein/1,5-bisphosphokinase (PRPP-forming) PhnN [Pseudomonas sp. RL_15y_Pfl2_60]|uniref:phosphonate metabolism protein/1,5-bisphosphokinase (PRPP-forming) PhnN n=1 Tax=Pseudomonas sp. RL_15y_Pfl2_60 TaxID=3088709 RepID=UPI0030DB8FC7